MPDEAPDREEVLEDLKRSLDEAEAGVAILMSENEGIVTFLYDGKTLDDPGLRTTALLTAAGINFLENLEAWALQEAGERGQEMAVDTVRIGPDGAVDDVDDDDLPPDGVSPGYE